VRERTDGTHRAGETGAHTPGVHPHAGLPALAVPVEGSAGAFFTIECRAVCCALCIAVPHP
jgi:hypothetical protein